MKQLFTAIMSKGKREGTNLVSYPKKYTRLAAAKLAANTYGAEWQEAHGCTDVSEQSCRNPSVCVWQTGRWRAGILCFMCT